MPDFSGIEMLPRGLMESEINWERIREGDERVFEKLYRNLHAPLCSVASRIINDRQAAEEIVQDVFSKIWSDRKVIDIHSSLSSYLFRSVRNLAINELKKRQTGKSSLIRPASNELWSFLINTSQSQDFIIEKMISRELRTELIKAVDSLPEQCRQVFQLSRSENKTNDEIASLLKISKNTVKSHLVHALKRISIVIRKEK